MVIKWYNRDSISDQDMKRAEAVANRLLGKKENIPVAITLEQLQKFYKEPVHSSLLSYHLVVSPLQYQVLKKLEEK